MGKGKRSLFFCFVALQLPQHLFIHYKGTEDYDFHKPFNLSTAPEVQSKYLGEHPLAMLCAGTRCYVVTAASCKEQTAAAPCTHARLLGQHLWRCGRASGSKRGMRCPGSLFLGAQHPLTSASKAWGFTGAEP